MASPNSLHRTEVTESTADACLTVDQQGAGNIAEFQLAGTTKITIDNSGNITIASGSGDSQTITLKDGDDATLTIQKKDTGEAVITNSEGALHIKCSGDTDDFLTIDTSGNVPVIGTSGACNLKITASSGTIDFDNENLSTTGTVTGGGFTTSGSTSTGGLTATGVVDLGGASSTEIVNGTNPTLDAAGEVAVDTDADGDLLDMGLLAYYDGTRKMWAVGIRQALVADWEDGMYLRYDATNDEFVVGTQYGTWSAGTLTIYVDPSGGSDSNLGTSGSKLATLQKAWDVVPNIVVMPVVIDLAAGTYSEEVTLQGKLVTSNGSITITGENALTQVDSQTADADCAVDTVECDAAGWTPSAHAGQLCIVPSNSQAVWIRDNDADTLNLGGKLGTDPDSTAFTINTLGAVISPGAGNIGIDCVQQSGVVVEYVKFSGGAYGYRQNGGQATVRFCQFDTQTTYAAYVYGAGYLSLTGCYAKDSTYSGIDVATGGYCIMNGVYVLSCNTSSAQGGVRFHDTASGYISRSYIDACDYVGILLDGSSVLRTATGATSKSVITNHDTAGDYGIYSQNGGHCIGASSQDFPVGTNDTDEAADAATFADNT